MEDGSPVAVKAMLISSCRELAENENDILRLVKTERSPFIVNYRDFLMTRQQPMFMYLILDLCEESLRKHVESKSIEYLRKCGPRMIKQILSGLEFLHDHNILHRDLKPSNVLVDITGRMRLADFGLSRVLDDDQSTLSTCPRGTVDWVPPEVIEAINAGIEKKGPFKKKSDVHVAGMIAFFILSRGEHPFGNPFDRMTNILEGKPLNLENLEDLEAKDFISWMICKNIWNRPDAGEALRHRFLAQVKMYEELSEPRILLVRDDSD